MYELHYQRPGDVRRVKRSTSGTTRRFTLAEAREFVRRCRVLYPNAQIVPFEPERPKVKPTRRKRSR